MKDYHILLEPITKIIFDINVNIRHYKENDHGFETRILELNDSQLGGFQGLKVVDDMNMASVSSFTEILLDHGSKISRQATDMLFEKGKDWEIELNRLIASAERLIEESSYNGRLKEALLKMSDSYTKQDKQVHGQVIIGLTYLITSTLKDMLTNLKYIRKNVDRFSVTHAPPELSQIEKIKYNGSASFMGFLMMELIDKGFIDMPISKGSPSLSALASLCNDYFDVDATIGTMKKAFSYDSNQLSDIKRLKLEIPNIKDVR